MVIQVPEYKKIQKGYNNVQEQFNISKMSLNNNQNKKKINPFIGITKPINAFGDGYFEKKVIDILNFLDIYDNYELIFKDIVYINIHNHLSITNVKKLSQLININICRFNEVDGDCNFSNNDLTDWSLFPLYIKGNCIAQHNKIKNFKGAPQIDGNIYADKQKTKTDYPLTTDNYMKYHNNIYENMVYVISVNRCGELTDINESKGYAVVRFDDNTSGKFRLNDIDCFNTVSNLMK